MFVIIFHFVYICEAIKEYEEETFYVFSFITDTWFRKPFWMSKAFIQSFFSEKLRNVTFYVIAFNFAGIYFSLKLCSTLVLFPYGKPIASVQFTEKHILSVPTYSATMDNASFPWVSLKCQVPLYWLICFSLYQYHIVLHATVLQWDLMSSLGILYDFSSNLSFIL